MEETVTGSPSLILLFLVCRSFFLFIPYSFLRTALLAFTGTLRSGITCSLTVISCENMQLFNIKNNSKCVHTSITLTHSFYLSIFSDRYSRQWNGHNRSLFEFLSLNCLYLVISFFYHPSQVYRCPLILT